MILVMRTSLLTCTLLLGALLPACVSDGPTGSLTIELLARDWVFDEGRGELVEGAEEMPTLHFDESGKFAGFSGVNRFHGKLDTRALVEGLFDMGSLVSTRKAGSPRAMELESRVFDALERADSCAMRDAELILFHEGDIVARLRPGS